jgi:hypothetical protein
MFNKAKDAIAGPGHKPAKPHPAPKSEEPIINFLFISLLVV